MLDELTPTHVTEFNGLFDRGPDEVIPLGHFGIAHNIQFINGGVETRYGTSLSLEAFTGVKRFFPYSIEGQADRIIFLDTTGRLYDSLYISSPILNIPTMTDFSMVVMNDRAYLSPHDGVTGMPGQFVYVYQGGGVAARLAAGAAPSGFTLTAAQSPLAGIVDAGLRLYAIAYETDSGFITQPGPATYASFTSIDGFQVRVTGISPGPVGTVARHLLATKAIVNFDGNQENQEFFFVEGGSLGDNVTTTIDLNFYDVQLVRSADYLKDEMTAIPAVLGFTTFAGSLVGWAPNVEPASVYISKAGEPESISLLEGGIEVDRTTGGGVKNCVEYRGETLMIHKSGRMYSVVNNGLEPVNWKPQKVDSGIGTEVFGVAAILDEEGNTVDRYVLATKKGIIAYAGNFENVITRKIEDVWKRITKTAFNRIQITLDPINELIFVAVPLDGSVSPNMILYCDYKNGLDAENVRWATWAFSVYVPTTIGIDVNTDGEPVFKIGSIGGHIFYLDPTAQGDNLVAMPDPVVQTAYAGDSNVAVNYYGGIRLRATGVGNLSVQFGGFDDNPTVNPPGFALGLTPGRMLQTEFNLLSQFGRLKCWTSAYGDRFKITKMSIYHNPFWAEEPV